MCHFLETENGLKPKKWIINIIENPAVVKIRLLGDKATAYWKGFITSLLVLLIFRIFDDLIQTCCVNNIHTLYFMSHKYEGDWLTVQAMDWCFVIFANIFLIICEMHKFLNLESCQGWESSNSIYTYTLLDNLLCTWQLLVNKVKKQFIMKFHLFGWTEIFLCTSVTETD